MRRARILSYLSARCQVFVTQASQVTILFLSIVKPILPSAMRPHLEQDVHGRQKIHFSDPRIRPQSLAHNFFLQFRSHSSVS
jgi:hypothetical protein